MNLNAIQFDDAAIYETDNSNTSVHSHQIELLDNEIYLEIDNGTNRISQNTSIEMKEQNSYASDRITIPSQIERPSPQPHSNNDSDKEKIYLDSNSVHDKNKRLNIKSHEIQILDDSSSDEEPLDPADLVSHFESDLFQTNLEDGSNTNKFAIRSHEIDISDSLSIDEEFQVPDTSNENLMSLIKTKIQKGFGTAPRQKQTVKIDKQREILTQPSKLPLTIQKPKRIVLRSKVMPKVTIRKHGLNNLQRKIFK